MNPVLIDLVEQAARNIQRTTRDINATARVLTAEINRAVAELTTRPFTDDFRGKMEKHLVEGISDARISKAIEMIAEEYPELR